MTPQTKIKKISNLFCLLFLIIFISIPIVHLFAWIYVPLPISLFGLRPDMISSSAGFIIRVIPEGIQVLHPLSFMTRLLGFLVTAMPIIALEFIFYYLIKLFRLYQRAEIFTINNVNYIKKTGYALLLMQIARPISEGIVSALVTWGNPLGSGTRKAVITLTGIDLSLVLTAFLIILISWIMAEGCRLREEQQLTI